MTTVLWISALLGYLIIFALFYWVVQSTNDYYAPSHPSVELWSALAFVWPVGLIIYLLLLIVNLPKALYEKFNYGWSVWRDYFYPWYKLLW